MHQAKHWDSEAPGGNPHSLFLGALSPARLRVDAGLAQESFAASFLGLVPAKQKHGGRSCSRSARVGAAWKQFRHDHKRTGGHSVHAEYKPRSVQKKKKSTGSWFVLTGASPACQGE